MSPDGNAMAINVYFDHRRYARGFDQAASLMLDDALAPLRGKLQMLFHVGDPYVRTGISQRIQQDQANIVPLALLMLVLTLTIALRHLAVAVIPLLTAGISILWTLGLMAALGIPVNIMTSIIPALLIIIGSTEDIHLLNEYHSSIIKGVKSKKAIRFMAKNMGIAVALTFITTYFGFLSIALNDLALLRQFGLIASTGLAFNFLATLLLIPASLKLFGARKDRLQKRPQVRPVYPFSAEIASLSQVSQTAGQREPVADIRHCRIWRPAVAGKQQCDGLLQCQLIVFQVCNNTA